MKIKLNGYVKLNTTTTAAVTANSTINGAFAELDNRIETEEETRSKAITDLTNSSTAIDKKLDAHIATITGNPHKVTAEDVGLKNVTNESKATMFTNPVFTGVPEAPTAAADTNTTQIATTAFVTDAVKTANDKVAWAAGYTDFDALYAAVKQKLEEEYTLVPKEKEEEEIPTV